MGITGKVIAGVVLAPIVILVGGIGGCEARKAYYDWQVRKMCEKDGGATVFEQVSISPEDAVTMRRVGGYFAIADERIAPARDQFVLRGTTTYLRQGEPSLQRLEQLVVRRSDGKVLARVVSYWRAGGDFPFTGSYPSSFSCPDGLAYYAEISKVFLLTKE